MNPTVITAALGLLFALATYRLGRSAGGRAERLSAIRFAAEAARQEAPSRRWADELPRSAPVTFGLPGSVGYVDPTDPSRAAAGGW